MSNLDHKSQMFGHFVQWCHQHFDTHLPVGVQLDASFQAFSVLFTITTGKDLTSFDLKNGEDSSVARIAFNRLRYLVCKEQMHQVWPISATKRTHVSDRSLCWHFFWGKMYAECQTLFTSHTIFHVNISSLRGSCLEGGGPGVLMTVGAKGLTSDFESLLP